MSSPSAHTGSALAAFPLAWRWLGDTGHPQLPRAALRRMHPLPPAAARTAFAVSQRLLRGQGLDDRQFRLAQLQTGDLAPPAVAAWLQACPLAPDSDICLSWEPELALQTCWAVFARHWNAFCYPASDDLVVFPDSLRWVVFYRHVQQLQYGERRAAAQTSANVQTFLKIGSAIPRTMPSTPPHKDPP